MLRLIRCNDLLLGSEDTATAFSTSDSTPTAAEDADGEEPDGSALASDRAYIFSSKNLETSYLAETLLCYVSIVSHLPPVHLDDLVVGRLCDCVEQLIQRFPAMVNKYDGAR